MICHIKLLSYEVNSDFQDSLADIHFKGKLAILSLNAAVRSAVLNHKWFGKSQRINNPLVVQRERDEKIASSNPQCEGSFHTQTSFGHKTSV